MKILITGNKGFIGSWACVYFFNKGFEVYGLDNMSSYGKRLFEIANLEKIVKDQKITNVEDVDTWKSWAELINPDIILHLAGQAIVPRAFKEPFMTFKSNTLGTLAVLEISKGIKNLKSTLCITSDKVYENLGEKTPFVETDKLGGTDIYSISKTCCELIANVYLKTHFENSTINLQTIRLGNVVGGGDWSINRLIPDLINSIDQKSIFKIRYYEATRPFQHVSDVVTGIYNIADASLNKRIITGNAWNLGPRDNSFATVREVIEIFKKIYPDLKIANDNIKIKEDLNLRVDVTKYCNQFNPPRDNSIESIMRTINWYKNFSNGLNSLDLINNDIK